MCQVSIQAENQSAPLLAVQQETQIHYPGFIDFCNSAVDGFVLAGFRFPLLSAGETILLEDSAQLGLAPMQLHSCNLFASCETGVLAISDSAGLPSSEKKRTRGKEESCLCKVGLK